MLRKCVTKDIRKFNCDPVKKVLDNKSLKLAKCKPCVSRKCIFALRINRTTANINEIVINIFDSTYNLYTCEDQREGNLPDQKENLTEAEEIILVMTKFYKPLVVRK